MTIYSKLLYLSLFFLTITSGIFESLSFFIFESIITILFFTIILKEKKLTITKVSSFVIYIFLILIVVGLIQGINYHSLAQAKIYLPFSLCPFLTLQDVNFLFAYLMLFLIIIQLFKTDEQTDKFLHTLLILFGIIVLILNFFPKDEFCTFFVCKREESKYIGLFFNRNSAGAFCSLAFFVSLSVMLYDFLKIKITNNKQKTKNIIIFILEFILTSFLFYHIIISLSRGAFLATLLTLFAFINLFIFYFIKDKKKKICYIVIILFMLTTTGFVILKNISAINNSSERYNTKSELKRLLYYKSAFNILKEYPLTGIGLSCSKLSNGYLKIPEQNIYLHNDWLEILLGVGYPISILILFLILLIIINLTKKIKTFEEDKRIKFICLCCGLLSFCIASSVDFHFHLPTTAFLFFSILAIVCSTYFNNNNKTKTLIINKKNIFLFLIPLFILIFMLNIELKKAIAWHYACFEPDIIKRRENCVKYSGHPEYLQRLVETYYELMFDKTTSSTLKDEYKYRTNLLSKRYLTLYPYNEEMIYIYDKTKQK